MTTVNAALTISALTAATSSAIALSVLAARRVMLLRPYGEALGGLALGAGLAQWTILLMDGGHG